MSTTEDGGPAFPKSDPHTHGTRGMSLRDYFAGQALQGLLADTEFKPSIKDGGEDFKTIAARSAYSYADAMIRARKVQS